MITEVGEINGGNKIMGSMCSYFSKEAKLSVWQIYCIEMRVGLVWIIIKTCWMQHGCSIQKLCEVNQEERLKNEWAELMLTEYKSKRQTLTNYAVWFGHTARLDEAQIAKQIYKEEQKSQEEGEDWESCNCMELMLKRKRWKI